MTLLSLNNMNTFDPPHLAAVILKQSYSMRVAMAKFVMRACLVYFICALNSERVDEHPFRFGT